MRALLLLLPLAACLAAADRPLDEGVKGGIEYIVRAAPDGARDARLVTLHNRTPDDVKVVLEIAGEASAGPSLLNVYIPRQSVWRDGEVLLTCRHGFRDLAIRSVVPGTLNVFRQQPVVEGRERVELVYEFEARR